ncbi:hypothetical protein, partial [Bacillus pumilus]|uniref:hypothetical protein n=1 Tax=Bacillus pumilus TaxID=1408 RepID=UPI001C92F8BE
TTFSPLLRFNPFSHKNTSSFSLFFNQISYLFTNNTINTSPTLTCPNLSFSLTFKFNHFFTNSHTNNTTHPLPNITPL